MKPLPILILDSSLDDAETPYWVPNEYEQVDGETFTTVISSEYDRLPLLIKLASCKLFNVILKLHNGLSK